MFQRKYIKRFWTKVYIPSEYEFECWSWLTGKNSDGYGEFWIGNKNIKAHRYIYQLLTLEEIGHISRYKGKDIV